MELGRRAGCAVGIALACVLLLAAPAHGASSRVVELDLNNFEHLTQVSTGATTGDWFIKFMAPWCGHCKLLTPTWEAVAKELDQRVNVGRVDCTKSGLLCQRMEVASYPTIVFFRHGRMYPYSARRRETEELVNFALAQYADAPSYEVPDPPSTFVKTVAMTEDYINSLRLNNDPALNALLVGMAISMTFVVPMMLVGCLYIWCISQPRQKFHAPSAEEVRAELERQRQQDEAEEEAADRREAKKDK